jgi:hypothetical protein
MTEWTFFARILPERVPLSFNFGSMDILAPHSGTKLKIKNLFAHQSQVTCKVIVEDGAPNLFFIRNILDDALRSVIDLLGYTQGLHFELDIISATSDTGEILTFGIEIPVLVEAHAASAGTQQIDGTLVQATLSDIGAKTALAALRKAMREALGTGFYCYQGIEAIMQAMRMDGQTNTQAWDRMRDTLKVDRAIIDYVKLHGDDRRHGRTANISEPERIKVFLITDKIIGRYLQFLIARTTLDSANFPAITMADFERG